MEMSKRKPTTETVVVNAPQGASALDATIAATPAEPDKLQTLADNINVAFKAVDAADVSVTSTRIEAGRLLIEARRRFTDQKLKGFDAWCKRYIQRSRSDIYKCMALAGSPNPIAAVAKERKGNAKAQKRHRTRQQSLTSETPRSPSQAVPVRTLVIPAAAAQTGSARVTLAHQLQNARDSATSTQSMRDYEKLLRVFRELCDHVETYLSSES